MTKRKSTLIAVAGATLLASAPLQAQQHVFADRDLFLNFRVVNSQSPPDVTVDLGNVTTFLSSVATARGYVVLDIAGQTAGFTDQFAASDLLDTLGAPSIDNPIGFSAGAEDPTTDTLWLTRQISGPNSTGSGLTTSAKQLASVQLHVVQQLEDVGIGYNGGSQLGSGNAATVGSGDANSYYSVTVDGTDTMDYKGFESPATGAGGPLEVSQGSTNNATVYAALWEVPPATTIHGTGGNPDVYLGYFTFQATGELDFTAEGTVQVPSLSIAQSGANVVISWANTGSYTLQKNSNLANPGGWAASGLTVATNAGGTGSNTVTIASPAGSAFFRLHNP